MPEEQASPTPSPPPPQPPAAPSSSSWFFSKPTPAPSAVEERIRPVAATPAPQPPRQRQQALNPVVLSVVAGASTGAIECFITYPTEYVKTNLQLGGGKYSGMIDCARQTVRQHGVLGLYKGMSVLLAGSIPKQAVRWGAFEVAAEKMRDADGGMATTRRILCGVFAGLVEGAVAVTPAESIKTSFIMDQRGERKYKSLVHGVRTMVAQDGISAVYRGFVPTCLKQALNQGVRFPAQFAALQVVAGEDRAKRSSPMYNGIAGVIAGCVSVLVTQPMDLVKTRMQSAPKSYNSTLHCFATVVTKEGAQVLYSGTFPRMVRVGANVGLTFTVFPLVKKFLNSL